MTLTIKTTGLQDYLEGGKGKFKLLIAGGSGAGKTRMASFSPKPIYLACEDGLMSVADRNVPYAEINSEEAMEAALSLLEQEAKRPPAQRRWETVVVDTIDAYERTVTTRYLQKKKKLEMEGFEDWGYLASRMNNVVGRLMLLPFNVIVLSHTKTKTINKVEYTVLKVKGEVGNSLPEDFDFVGMLRNEPGVIDGKPGTRRFLDWKSSPDAQWLKCRGGALTETEVTFSESDFAQIFDGIRKMAEGLHDGEDVQTIETPEEAEPVAPTPGGPMGTGHKTGASHVPAKQAPPKAAPASRVPPPPPVVSPPPAAKAPDLTPPPKSMEEAVENVEKGIGGEVIEDTADPSVALKAQERDAEAAKQAEASETPVTEAPQPTEPEDDPNVIQGELVDEAEDRELEDKAELAEAVGKAPEPVNDAPVLPEDGEVDVFCGQARYPDSEPKAQGCGQKIRVTLQSGRIVATDTSDRADLMEIAGMRERTFLDNACFAKARQAATAATS